MPTKQAGFNQIAEIVMIAIGVGLIITSAFIASSYLAVLGTAAIFWGAILFYITPSKQVPLTVLDALANSSLDNIERLLFEFNSNEKGVYLPPKSLKNAESSLIFIPRTPQTPLPSAEENDEVLYLEQKDGLFLTPPGKGLLQLFEKEGATSFIKIDLQTFEKTFPKILVEDLELAENIEIVSEQKDVKITITGNVFSEICEQTNDNPLAHAQVGCILTSALACALAKASGKPIIIENEICDQENKTTTIVFTMKDYDLPSMIPSLATELTVLQSTFQETVKKQLTIATEKRIESEEEPKLVIEPISSQTIQQVDQIASAVKRTQDLEFILKSERAQLALDSAELEKAINEKENKLYQEIIATREKIKKLKSLLNDKDSRVIESGNPKPKANTSNKEKPKDE
jgi:hypothetical protein